MDTISKVMLVTHTLIAIGIIALVLLQRGKGADAGAAFGAGASGTVFGARGSSSFFSRTTAILATAFFATSLTLAYLSSQRTGAPESLLEGAPALEEPPEVRVRFDYAVRRESEDTVLVSGAVTLCFFDTERRRTVRVPEHVRAAFAAATA